MRNLLIVFCVIATAFASYGQSNLFVGKNFRNAYEKGTRSKEGIPGENYWQNHVKYDIHVEVVPGTKMLKGSESIVFTNNSPDVLNQIVVRLYQNAFKKGAAHNIPLPLDGTTNGMNIKECVISGKTVNIEDSRLFHVNGTNLIIQLEEPLLPNSDLDISFKWDHQIPKSTIRQGYLDDSSFFVGGWYPQISVYDDVYGWDQLQYTFDSEFYNNLADFNVNITVPDNFLVWSTGTMENAKEVFSDKIYERYTKAKRSDKVVHVVTKNDLKDLKMKSTTWTFKADDISDFAFAMSDHFLWDAASQQINDRRVLINNAYYKDKRRVLGDGVEVLQTAMKFFSEEMPGVPYPYPTYNSFLGLSDMGGMEFPMITNVGSINTGVLMHELFHSYLPMYVRTNERRFAWMDEGFAFFTNTMLMKERFPRVFRMRGGASIASRFKKEMNNVSEDIKVCAGFSKGYLNYDVNVSNSTDYQMYLLPGYVNHLLFEYLGDAKFKGIYKKYVETWAKKSPTPYDYFFFFEKMSGEDLSWIWKPWFFEMGSADLAVESFENGVLKVNKVGSRPLGVSITVNYTDQSELKPYYTSHNISVWKDDRNVLDELIPNADKVLSIVVNDDMPDFDVWNNYYPSVEDRYKKVSDLSSITGEYMVKMLRANATITIKDGKLFFEVKSRRVAQFLIPLDEDHFVTVDNFAKITLDKKDGKIVGLIITAFGRDIKAVRQ
ncbi:M1 family metallopeptidase [Halosquirtibacter xylanolyticus]|uniref:M1 family metallopeptidase n=1 Tax=Halosquirtibacter xylanolyticus TaxID=3374599 RepID=UPI00374A5E10|nr:M1 family metallopeptidase [Prolixibacteraceae bacterium]